MQLLPRYKIFSILIIDHECITENVVMTDRCGFRSDIVHSRLFAHSLTLIIFLIIFWLHVFLVHFSKSKSINLLRFKSSVPINFNIEQFLFMFSCFCACISNIKVKENCMWKNFPKMSECYMLHLLEFMLWNKWFIS